MAGMKELESGWDYDAYGQGVYHFEHILLTEADEKKDEADYVHVVETINWTFAGGKQCDKVHFNKYFAVNLEEAIGLAARMIIDFQEVAETIVSIRPATEEEEIAFKDAEKYFMDKMPEAISDSTPLPVKRFRRNGQEKTE